MWQVSCDGRDLDIDNKTFDLDACIGCYGCINRCPQHAISVDCPEVEEFMKGFIASFQNARLEPEMFM